MDEHLNKLEKVCEDIKILFTLSEQENKSLQRIKDKIDGLIRFKYTANLDDMLSEQFIYDLMMENSFSWNVHTERMTSILDDYKHKQSYHVNSNHLWSELMDKLEQLLENEVGQEP